MDTEHVETVIVGGGQAGLATGYFLKKKGVPFVILDAEERVGDVWRHRWDSLRLFTYARYAGLPGLRFPAPAWSFPTKDDMADYLETYATTFSLDVRSGVRVDSVSKQGDRFVVTAGDRRYEAENVVVATGAHRIPKVPPFAAELDESIVQLHSSEYRRPSQLRDGGVLLVGAGNSGADIAMDVVRDHPTWLSGRDPGQIPVRLDRASGKISFPVVRFVFHHVITRGTPIGRRQGPRLLVKGDPRVRVRTKNLEAAGVERVARVAAVRGGRPVLEDGRVLDVANVIWCTGFRNEYPWIDVPVFDAHGEPIHDRGVVESAPGLFFIGLPFQYSLSSCVLPGIGRDHAYVADHVASRGLRAGSIVRFTGRRVSVLDGEDRASAFARTIRAIDALAWVMSRRREHDGEALPPPPTSAVGPGVSSDTGRPTRSGTERTGGCSLKRNRASPRSGRPRATGGSTSSSGSRGSWSGG